MSWAELEKLRLKMYRQILPWFGPELAEVVVNRDVNQEKQLQMKADREWKRATGAPAMTSFENCEIVRAIAMAAGYPATHAGLLAWIINLAKPKWSAAQSPADWQKQFSVSETTFRRRVKAGDIRMEQISTKSIRIHLDDVARFTAK
jgi:hypothetical protein